MILVYKNPKTGKENNICIAGGTLDDNTLIRYAETKAEQFINTTITR